MKNLPKRVRQKTRSSPSPYAKYGKRPYKYSPKYHAWRKNRLEGRPVDGETPAPLEGKRQQSRRVRHDQANA